MILLNRKYLINVFLFFPSRNESSTTLVQVREQMTGLCVSILHTYHKFGAIASSSGHLILPEVLKILPFYTLGTWCRNNQPWEK